MNHSFDSVPHDDPLVKTPFHYLLVAFAAPVRWPVTVIYLAMGGLAAGTAAAWATPDSGFTNVAVAFLIMVSFFSADRELLAGLPRRRLSFGPWQSQLFALALPRAIVALVLGLLVPRLGHLPAFYLNIAAQFLGTVALYRGAVVEPRRLSLTELSVNSSRMSPGTPPLRILHISDLHIERLGDREARLLELVRAAEPEVILITGDYVNISFNVDTTTHAQIRELLGKLSAPSGVYAVLGSPAVDLPDIVPPLFEGLPVRLLRNEVIELNGPNGQAAVLIGLDCRHRIDADTIALDRALATVKGSGPRVLLYHSPELMPQAVERGIDLYLCGHTHGGQVRLPLIGPLLTSSKLGRRYVMGHYHESATHLYVSRGVGFEGLGAPRVRLFCPPEVALITLTADK